MAKAAATFEGIMSDLKAKKYLPVYFLQGDEPYFIDKIASYIEENVLNETEKIFNQSVVYGKDVDVRSVDALAKSFPAMAQNRVVIVKEAQDLKKIEDLVFYAEKPLKSTLLVICYKYKKLDSRKKICAAIEKNGVLFTSAKLYENKIPAWIDSYVKSAGFTCDEKVKNLLTEYLGTDLSKIANEIDKLFITKQQGSAITLDDVQNNIGISKDYNNFELQNVIGRGDVAKAARIVDHFAKNQKDNPLVLTITSLYGFFSKMLVYWQYKSQGAQKQAAMMGCSPFFLKDYDTASRRLSLQKVVKCISLLREYDLKSKGVNNVSTDAGGLLEELIFKIMH